MIFRIALAVVLIVASVLVLESARWPVETAHFRVGETPVTSYALPGADGPPVVVAHGFAGSSQMMQGYALPLARAGYRVFAFDFLGHGRDPVPMSGDVSSVDGTTRLLVEQTGAVIDAVARPGETVALLGHSMATDVLVRVARARDDIGPLVLLSAFSREIDASEPKTLLLVTGAWEPGLKGFALEAVRMVDPEAYAGETVTAGEVTRRAAVAPWTEHVSILQSRVARAEAVAWMDRAFGRSSNVTILPTGHAIIGLIAGLVLLFTALARRLPRRNVPTLALSRGRLALVLLLPSLVTPTLAIALNPGLMPVLVADYLALHLAIYGALQLALLAVWRVPFGRFSGQGVLFLLIASAVVGLALDRYAANFWPTADRAWIIAAITLGAVPYFVADARLAHEATIRRRLMLRGVFLGSLVLAVAQDFEGLFFLLLIAPVIVLFYAVFGTLGHAVGARAGPLAAGAGLGLVLAWALGVSFPLFQA